MWLRIFQGLAVILTSLLEAFLRNKESKDLRNEKLEAKDGAIELKNIEAKILSEHTGSKPDTLERLRTKHKSE